MESRDMEVPQAPPVTHESQVDLGPLDEAHFQAIREALAIRKPIRRAARIANRSALSILAFGIAGIPIVFFSPSFTNIVVTVTLCFIGRLEYSGARKMSRGLPAAASHLGWNQVVFISLICLYCVDQMMQASTNQYISPQLRSQLSQVGGLSSDIDSMVAIAVYGFYSLVIVLSATLQGCLAWYYFSRRQLLEAVQQATPDWINRLLNEVAA
jgi:hypothetical protein